MGRAELPRVFTTKTQFWYIYEGFARDGASADRNMTPLTKANPSLCISRASLLELLKKCPYGRLLKKDAFYKALKNEKVATIFVAIFFCVFKIYKTIIDKIVDLAQLVILRHYYVV